MSKKKETLEEVINLLKREADFSKHIEFADVEGLRIGDRLTLLGKVTNIFDSVGDPDFRYTYGYQDALPEGYENLGLLELNNTTKILFSKKDLERTALIGKEYDKDLANKLKSGEKFTIAEALSYRIGETIIVIAEVVAKSETEAGNVLFLGTSFIFGRKQPKDPSYEI